MLIAAAHLVVPGAILACALMFVLWLVYLRLNNASYVDPGWAYGLAILGATYSALGSGYSVRRWLVAAMAATWGLRLGTHLLVRIVGKPEEGRYQQLRKEWGKNIELKFLIFFEFQGLLDLLLSLPFLLAALNPDPKLSAVEYVGMGLWVISLAGEALADAQLAAFKRGNPPVSEVCRRGLWNYSRHPNYFFEWLIWVAWFLFALGSPFGWLAALCPVLMLYLLLKVTGIPATEAQSLRSKGEAYRAYQRTTSVFVPWFKREFVNL
jgi:steroid 5-alpha reductase family enzyme